MRFAAALAAAGLLLIALAAAGLVAAVGDAHAQSPTTVQVGDFYFCDPSFGAGVCETTVNEGDTVEWQFVGDQLHTTTECSDDHDSCSAPHLWDSPLLDSGTFSFTFETPGTYLYRCQAHTFEMRGRVIVLAAAAQPTPTPQASPPASTPTATPALAAQPSVVPSGGGSPPPDGGPGLWWVAVLAGGMLIASAAGLAARGLRRRDV